MEFLGATIKKLREEKGFTVKEVYTGVVSRTTAYRFENDFTDIGFSNLREITHRLNISSLDELVYLRNKWFTVTEGDDSLLSAVNKEITMHQTQAYDPKWENVSIYQQFKDSPNSKERFYAYLIHFVALLNMWHVDQDIVTFPSEFTAEYQFMQQYLLKMTTWTKDELEIFPVIGCFFEPTSRTVLLKRFKVNYAKYHEHIGQSWYDSYINHLLNYALSINTYDKQPATYVEIDQIVSEINALYDKQPDLKLNLINYQRLILLNGIVGATNQDYQRVALSFEMFQQLKTFFGTNIGVFDVGTDIGVFEYLENYLTTETQALFPAYFNQI